MSTTKFYKFYVNGNEFICFYTMLFDRGVVSIKSGGCWCDRTIRFNSNRAIRFDADRTIQTGTDGKPFFTWNGKTVFMDDLVETDF